METIKNVFIKENIRTLRLSKRVTLQKLSDITDSGGRSTVKSWERGDSTPCIYKILVLCEYFNISIDDFVRTKIVIN